MKRFFIYIFCALLFAQISCSKDDDGSETVEALTYTEGKNSYRIEVNGFERNFHVHVPQTYDESTATPLVCMCHGSGGNGNVVYDNSGWKEVADREGFICVFPTALEYFVLELNRNQTKWSAAGLDTELDPSTQIEDDLPFVEEMKKKMDATFNIDQSRIYASGFSNGGGFTKSRLMCEWSDVIAAVATSGGHGLPQVVPVQSPDLIAIHTIMGNEDDKKLKLAGQSNPFPMDSESIMMHSYLRGSIDNILEMLELSAEYSSNPEPPNFNTIIFSSPQSQFDNEYRFTMVNKMGHIWPNGSNHSSGLNAAELFWEFFKEYKK